ncbi:Hypothetical protein, putative [Bodo saltans]|uniref:Membrane-associated protein n=1 Tax=Bodo saltans TaxID=75058 RepID=A0A0S4IQT4_BODSA|nr:Hypothetical protein, putative [Bodo saltans]|eukprot:CUF33911.1 Hypothetical protein, putative [Bodo saltans]
MRMSSAFVCLSASILAAVVLLSGEAVAKENTCDKDPNSHQCSIEKDRSAGETIIQDRLVVLLSGEAVAKENTCDKDPNSHQCSIEKDRSAGETIIQDRLDKQSADYNDLSVLVAQLEDLCHGWCCAATGQGLYSVHGDKDVFNFVYTILSQTLARNGQHYGSELVQKFFREREDSLVAIPCAAVTYGQASHFNNLLEVVLQLKDLVSVWLRRNEVDPTNIVSSVIPQARTLLGRWGVARLLVHKDPSKADSYDPRNPTVPVEEVPLSILPLLNDDDAADERCAAASQLTVMYRSAKSEATSAKLQASLAKMLDECYESGRVSAQPASFGEHLLEAGREEQARELFDLAVQRGTICNPFQRPEMLLRKDLTATPVWSLTSFPADVVKGFMGLQDEVAKAVRNPNFMFSNDTETMSMFLKQGTWERTILFASHTWQEYNCNQLGEATCAKAKRLVTTVLESNDAYMTQCNGSLALDIWRLSHDLETQRSVLGTYDSVRISHVAGVQLQSAR